MTTSSPAPSFLASIFILALGLSGARIAHAADGHAADDELALAAAELAGPADVSATFITGGAAAAVEPADCITSGAWGGVISWTPHIPVSAANLPDGRILTFASNQRTTFPSGVEFSYAATWDPATGQFQEFNHNSHDMFCGGITLMPDGRVMVNGGRNETPFASVFDWRNNTWTRVQSMNGGRWYNTSVSLPNGNVFTATGSGTGVNTTERWSPAGWTVMTGIPWPTVIGSDAGYMREWHPFLSVAPDGRVLHFGPTDTMHWLGMSGTGSTTNAGATIPGTQYPKEGCFAMYDEGRVLAAGGGRNTVAASYDGSIGTSTAAAYTVNMNVNPPAAVATASMAYPRQFANAVVLPSGEVLVIGGNSPGRKFSDEGSVMPCEIWNPRTGTWRTVASISVPRNYHSVALLLPDGRVWSGGGGLGGGDHRDAQLYTPPCLFNADGTAATRPVLSSAPATIAPSMTFNVTGTAGLVKFAFIRMAALTHSVNTDQRYLSVPFTEASAGSYQLTAHASVNSLLPGYWMLFGINANGAYSVARIIKIDAAAGITLNPPGNQDSTVGVEDSLQLTASAPAGITLAYSATGLPPGLGINGATGRISGTPTSSGVFSVRATASGGGLSASQDFTWTVLLANTGSGTILREWWLNIGPGMDVIDLTSNPAFPNSPTGRDQRTSFETPTDWADNMGQRVRGYVHPPVTGQYRFWIASDDGSSLLLSTSRDPASATEIASAPDWTSPREWTRFPQQASVLITLQAGQSYYIEALMKEGGGGDNLAVAWAVPGTTTPVVIAGQYLSPWVINRAPTLTNPGNRANVIGSAATLNVQAVDADGDPLAFSATNLPAGLTINASTGVIAGTPSATGVFNTAVSVTDNRSTPVTASFVWTIVAQVNLNPPAAAPVSPAGSTINYSTSSTGGLNVRYKWSWGDGTADSAYSSSPTASHAFAAPGRYQITITATDDTGRITTATFFQGIHAALTTRAPTASSSIVYEDRPAGTNDRVWCVNPDNNSISVFDAVTRARLAEITAGASPRSLAIAPDGRVWVTNHESASVSIIHGSTLAVVQTITLARGARPFGIAFDPDGTDGWIACEGTGQLLRMNPATGAQAASFDAGLNARHVSVSADGARVFVTRFITPLLPGENTGTVSTPDTAGGEVLSVITATLALEKKTILIHSTRPDTITTGRGIPNYLGPAVVSPDGLTAWVPSKQDNIKRGTLRDGFQLTHEQTVRSIASRIPLAGGVPASTDDMQGRVDFDNAGIASNGAFEPKGIYFFAALEGSREIGVVDVWGRREAKRFTAGRAPQGVAVSPDGRTVYAHNFMDRTITVHNAGALLDGADATPALVATLNCVSTERLAANVLLGKQHFYDAADPRIAFQQYISCASCHNDGGQDGRVWDFTGIGEGLRNTITLRGHGGVAQGPLHWTGNFEEVQDFENQIRNLNLGTGLIAGANPHPPLGTPNAGRSADLDALAAYVTSLSTQDSSPHRNADGSLTAAASAGRTVFMNSNCAQCHSGAPFTNSALNVFANIGTIKPSSGQRLGAPLTGLDVPTLRGLWATAPYLHDGTAATLAAAVQAHQGVSLSATDLANLAAYLQQVDGGEASAPALGAPTITLSAPASASAAFSVAISASQNVTGLVAGDFVITNGAAGVLSGSGASWSLVVNPSAAGTVTVALPANACVNIANVGNTASNVASVNYTPPATLSGSDIGATGVAGSTTFAGGVYTVRGSGPDIYYTADGFHFASTSITGDGEIRARVTGMTNTASWAKAGVMIREDLAPGSRHGTVYVTPYETRNGFEMLKRTTTNGSTTDIAGPANNPPPDNWVRLVRSGNTITGFASANGSTWTQVHAASYASLPATLYLGLCVTSASSGALCTATFDNVQITGSVVQPTAPAAPTGLAASAQSSSQIRLTWNDVAANETGYRVERAAGAGAYSVVATLAAGSTSYVDGGLAASTLYNYKVTAFNGAGTGVAGPVSATTHASSGGTMLAGADVGVTGLAGSTSLSSGVYTVRGAGADIYGTADSFHFASASLTGDGEIRARVASLTNTGAWAKAGVMIRESNAPGARNAIVYTTPYETGNGSEVMWRETAGGTTTYFDGYAANPPPNNWVRLVRAGNSITGYLSADGASWTTVRTVTFTNLPSTLLFGLAVCSTNTGALATATFDNVQVVPATSGGTMLAGADVGVTGLAGSTSLSSGVYTVRGAGADIYGTADSFHFASASLTGDGEIRARVASLTNTGAWAKAGVMIRESNAPGARNAIVYTTPYETGNGSEVMWRETAGGTTTYFDGYAANPPPNNWVRLVRAGNSITGYLSADGVSWTTVRTVTFTNLPSTLLFGLAVCSTNTGALATATFDNVAVSSGVAGAAAATQVSGSLPGLTLPELTAAEAEDGTLSLTFTRPASASGTVRLQVIGDLADSPSGWATATTRPQATRNADGSVTYAVPDIMAELGGAPQGFARLYAELDVNGDGFADVERAGEVFGFAVRVFEPGAATFGQAFAAPVIARATITAAGAGVITLGSPLPPLDGGEHYLEVVRGANAGHRFEINEAASAGAALGIETASARTTLASLPATLVGDVAVIRAHRAVAALFPVSRFTGGAQPSTADRLQFYNGASFDTLWLLRRADGSRQWVRQGDAALADAGRRVVDVAEGLLIQIRNQAVSVISSGMVRANAVALPLKTGTQLVANPWPADMSPAGMGMTSARGWIGASSVPGADRIQLWRGDSSASATGYDTLFLLVSGALNQWTAQGDAALADLSNAPLLPVLRAAFIKSTNHKPGFVALNPFQF